MRRSVWRSHGLCWTMVMVLKQAQPMTVRCRRVRQVVEHRARPRQCDLLTATDKYIILNCSRQSGKSTIVAILALHHALTTPGARVLIVSPSLRQSELLFDKINTFYRRLGRPGGSDADSATELRLRNGSRIVALPGSESTIRGFTASLVLIDEAARISNEVYYAVTPMVTVSKGRLILLSTPHGKQGIFWRAWDHEPDWMKVKVTADHCPRITQESLDHERRALPPERFAQEYCCEFVQDEACTVNESWVQFYDPKYTPYMDVIIQSWDTAQTKSASSDYVVGQVWGRIGADFYLLDQKRGRWDFDETVEAMKIMTEEWPNSSAKLIEAQTFGAALASHLKHEIPDLIPIHVTGSKELRALNCVPVWRSKNVYIPKPDDGEYRWVYAHVRELTTFPNAEHDDQVEATTLALNQLQGPLYPDSKRCAVEESKICTQLRPDHHYWVCWIPARQTENYTVLVYDMNTHDVVSFERFEAEPVGAQRNTVHAAARTYNSAGVRAFGGMDDALLRELEEEGVYVERDQSLPTCVSCR
jgi:predicted phage terminase large subunit-like protein